VEVWLRDPSPALRRAHTALARTLLQSIFWGRLAARAVWRARVSYGWRQSDPTAAARILLVHILITFTQCASLLLRPRAAESPALSAAGGQGSYNQNHGEQWVERISWGPVLWFGATHFSFSGGLVWMVDFWGCFGQACTRPCWDNRHKGI
jgi:hypothetical protein